jgi:hypothetical protein
MWRLKQQRTHDALGLIFSSSKTMKSVACQTYVEGKKGFQKSFGPSHFPLSHFELKKQKKQKRAFDGKFFLASEYATVAIH